MQRAAEISANPLYRRLTARYFYESDQTSLGLAFLDTMIETTTDKAVKKNLSVSQGGLAGRNGLLEQALSGILVQKRQQVAKELKELVHAGCIEVA